MKSGETKDQVEQLHKMIFASLQNREHCLRTLGSIVVGLTPGTAQNYDVSEIKTLQSAAGERIAVNTGASYNADTTYMNGNVRIDSMNLRTTTNLGDPQPFVINYRRLEKGANTRTKVGFGGSSLSKTLWIRLQRATAASTAITGCYAVEIAADADSGSGNQDLNKDFCERLGTGGSLYTWDATRNSCVLKNNVCPAKFVFEGISSNGSAICRSINEYLPYLAQPGTNPCTATKTQVQIVRDPVTNKVSIECQ
jgi:hypothetical protein